MNYCAVGEAFDNSLKQQLADYEKNNKNNNDNNNLIQPGTFDTYEAVETNNGQNIYPAFFTAQGHYSAKNSHNEGTTIKDLQNCQTEDSDNLSFLDSNLSEKSAKAYKHHEPTKIIDHNYCVNKIIKNIIEEPDIFSLGSSENDVVYKHVKTCKICKKKIDEKLKDHYKVTTQQNQQLSKKEVHTDKLEHFNFEIPNLGYNLKEIMVIILGGIILIFILDLLVKIGKKMKP
ncbi:hypothetical protein Klosneuvirus_1_73 [Klosneuvirus KNV1]|uniref:Uncharacterized protein n=1 Tax=Klosneuvirus KNV1 TaxID=1977640 RepID=A0A1V0SHL1_9VIRU|nr:hypothetical protein Klosneuvirus_1_73 [Klosneuvirus KNV1]